MEAHELQLAVYRITDDCKGCGVCRKKCPWNAVLGAKKERHVIEPTLCRGCGTCWSVCPRRAVEDANGTRRADRERGQAPRARIDGCACAGCQNCLLNCEQSAIRYERRLLAGHCVVDQDRCIGCGSCLTFCASDCIGLV